MGHIVQATAGQLKKDMVLTINQTPGVDVTAIDEITVWIGADFGRKRGSALARLIECRDTLIEQDLHQDEDFYDATVDGRKGKGAVVLTATALAAPVPTNCDIQITVGANFGGVGGLVTKSGIFKSTVLQAVERLNEGLSKF